MTDPLFPPVIERPDGNRCEIWQSGKVVSWKRTTFTKGRYIIDSKGARYRKQLAATMRVACPVTLRSPVAVEMLVVYPRNKARPDVVSTDDWKTGRECLRPTLNRDDLDRLQGNVFDALKDAGVIEDDGCIVDIHARKVWAKEGDEPGLLLRVREVGYLF